MSSRHSARQWLTRSAVVAAGLGIAAGAMAPAASATDYTEIYQGNRPQCLIWHDVEFGPVFAGETWGNCGVTPGEVVQGAGSDPDGFAIGQVYLPNGMSFSAWVDRTW